MGTKLKPKRVTHAQLIARSVSRLSDCSIPPANAAKYTVEYIQRMYIRALFLRVDEYYMLRGFRVFGDAVYNHYD